LKDAQTIYLKWFIQLAQGSNIRKCSGLPYPMTKKMAHCFTTLQSKSIKDAFYNAFVIGHGGSMRLIHHLKSSEFDYKEDINWSAQFIRILVQDEDLAIKNLELIKEYMIHLFNHDEKPGLKKLSLINLIKRATEWKVLSGKSFKTWKALPAKPLTQLSDWKDSVGEIYIKELTDSTALRREGKLMKHCVGSYHYYCTRYAVHIFSIRIKTWEGRTYILATIEYKAEDKFIVQAKGKCNNEVSFAGMKFLREWAALNEFKLNNCL